MKKIGLALILLSSLLAQSQNMFWVFFTDKANTTFNPYEYFDQKAIERRLQLHLSLYDSTDFPLNANYVRQVGKLSEEVVGETRWFNALAVVATADNIAKIAQYKFVKEIVPIETEANLTSVNEPEINVNAYLDALTDSTLKVHKQLKRMGGDLFVNEGIDGKGIRIAVFDGGFPSVDKHDAFKHLRENHQIIKTWNFPLKKENVYGWNSHGTMTLSCIAGIEKNKKIGLATGAEFLLARTEVSIEPAREEVWWMQAVEWADKNGANIISSSLGYGDTRHKVSDMNGKKCLVTRAANMAASKGILVCNSMGNEGDKQTWRTLIAPADADSVLAVGGINPYNDKHTDFSSYGPTADGRIKPNVCAFATQCEVASPCKEKECSSFTQASGTSFSCPLVAGFAACAWQKHPELKAMELKNAIERSADLYPYYDYAYGYGVPQAAYFMFPKIDVVLKTFDIMEDSTYIIIKPFEMKAGNKIFFHIQRKDSTLIAYENLYFQEESANELKINKSALYKNNILRVYYEGYVESYTLSEEAIKQMETPNIENSNKKTESPLFVLNSFSKDYKTPIKLSKYGINAKHSVQAYLSWGFVFFDKDIIISDFWYGKSNGFNVGLRYKGNVSKWYSLGIGLEYSKIDLFYHKIIYSELIPVEDYKLMTSKISNNCFNVELYQRFRLFPTERSGMGCYLDLGIFIGFPINNFYTIKYKIDNKLVTEKIKNSNYFNSGLRARLGYELFSLYVDMILMDNIYPFYNLGLQFTIPFSR